MKHVIIFLIIWLTLTAIGYGIGSLIFNSNDSHQFANRGKTIYGTVTSKEKYNHGTIQYTYQVNSVQYSGFGGSGRGNPQFDEIQVGQQLVLFYDPEAPERSRSGYPQFYSETNNWQILLVTIFFPIIPLITIYSSYLLFIYLKRSQLTNPID